jgi:3-methyl-2-oxobutanoate hydroxymethyltransferase
VTQQPPQPIGGTSDPAAKVSIPELLKLKGARRWAMMTAYDYPTAKLVDAAGIECILVGDSLGMVVLGYPTTVPVTMDDMVRHASAVSRGAKRALLVGDMPFATYQTSPADAFRNASRFLKEAGMDAVKVEGGAEIVETVRHLVRNGIAVMGHLGLTPQRVAQFGGFKVQAKDARAARQLIDDALALEEAGAFSIVLESVPARVAALATERLSIPTIGIGAGQHCDAQVLVLHDALGLFQDFTPKFAKRYAELATVILEAMRTYRAEVLEGTFPTPAHSFTMKDEEFAKLRESLQQPKRPRALP